MNEFPDDIYLALIPVQVLASEAGEDGKVVLIRPKILSARWSWFLKLMGKPAYRVKLDVRGSAVWAACDGARNVAQVAAVVDGAFPGEADAVLRTALFLRELQRGGFIQFMQV